MVRLRPGKEPLSCMTHLGKVKAMIYEVTMTSFWSDFRNWLVRKIFFF